ncbi:type II toxin-antitoxin system Phd/YefM family antitoxin [Acidiphilium sp. PA]|uniref:type II toxin-antitoxin system Phd/YefM family antitoxin n=1 Tax=Acidiphilium sp. PA TaxID=2871705 RepID=UPI002243E5C0|nr:type II toxin-antitoxin system Phd/YefM family antitoxin [Acidiphilium sp. PA]MCW8307963.1 type II toxin-antitoxin system Phd/YefM family antitoxin [Acidiphilium sp. PA]
MREIQLRDAQAALSAVVDDAVRGEPAIITRHGKPEPVVLSFAEWQRLSRVPSFGQLLMAAPLDEIDLPLIPPTRQTRPIMPRPKNGLCRWLTTEPAAARAAQSPAVQALSWDLSKAVVRRDGNRLVWRVSTNHFGAQCWVESDDATRAVSKVHHAPER